MDKMKCLFAGPLPHSLAGEIMMREGSGLDTGGLSVFAGQVRADIVDGRKVKAIEYSAYEAMVEKEVEAIRSQIMSAYGDVRTVSIVHSVGEVKAGELSLLVVVTAGHRDHAIRACADAVELVKEHLPVWKKELFEDTGYRWV
jgi:molybdopterin synthase catalytic subunit